MSQKSLIIFSGISQISNHMMKHSWNLGIWDTFKKMFPYSKESFAGLADIGKTIIIEQNLLDNESGNGSREFLASLHDSETKRNNFSLHQEINSIAIITLIEII